MSTYTVKPGETITDVVINSTGNIDNWDAILTANNFADWTPQLAAGQIIQIPDALVSVDQNVLRGVQQYPICNASVPDVYDQIDDIVNTLEDNWILSTGYWNVNALWLLNGTWNLGN
jgi:phage tail protein X